MDDRHHTKDNKQTMDIKWWPKLTWPLARWAKNEYHTSLSYKWRMYVWSNVIELVITIKKISKTVKSNKHAINHNVKLNCIDIFWFREDRKSEVKDDDNRSRSEVKLDVVVNMIDSVSEDMVYFKEKVSVRSSYRSNISISWRCKEIWTKSYLDQRNMDKELLRSPIVMEIAIFQSK